MKLRKGDKVIVISGKDKGKTGIIQRAYPSLNKVVVEGINVKKKHIKPSQTHPEGSIVEVYAPLDASKVMYYDEKTKKGTRLGYSVNADGNKVRISKKTKKEVK